MEDRNNFNIGYSSLPPFKDKLGRPVLGVNRVGRPLSPGADGYIDTATPDLPQSDNSMPSLTPQL